MTAVYTLIIPVVGALLLIGQPALGAGYNHQTGEPIPAADSPHGGYAATTNKCKTCHAAHLAEGNPDASSSYVLLRANTASDECDYCHGSGGLSEKIISGGSHETHLGSAKGPAALQCSDCHKVHTNLVGPQFADGEPKASTAVCDNCHSPQGAFDGVNDLDYGAKPNWTAAVYDGDNLRPGKEKWCISCHDADQASSSQDGTGVAAPDVSGDNVVFGYYVSGHRISCMNCHDASGDHLDGVARTFAYDETIANSDGQEYRRGYRLTLVDGLEPMRIPINSSFINQYDPANYRLCLECHSWDNLTDSTEPYDTNFNHSGPNPPLADSYGYNTATSLNSHLKYHLNMAEGEHIGVSKPYWDSDWDLLTTAASATYPNTGYDSFISCVTCHEVHGAKSYNGNTQGTMIRDGRLQGREPGLQFTYVKEAAGGYPNVTSVGADKANSTGAIMRSGVDERAQTGGQICGGCHPFAAPTTDEYDATGAPATGCLSCHRPWDDISTNYYLEYYRIPGGGALDCVTCHLGTGDIDNFASDGIPAIIDQAEWGTSGHGRTNVTGAYPASGNPAASLGCDACHDDNVSHGASQNFFRLKNTSDVTWGKNYTCQSCHASGESGATKKLDSTHFGIDHDINKNGGQFCWDCHDPHGDSNIFMVQLRPAVTSDPVTTVPTDFTTNNAAFTGNATGTDYAKSSAPFDGVCNVCHTAANHYTESSGDEHYATELCTACHPHTSSSDNNGAFAHGGSGTGCIDCHGYDATATSSLNMVASSALDAEPSQGAGTYQSHSTHTETDSDDARGPGIGCDGCHDTNNFPDFKSGTDENQDGRYDLSETDACDACHSPGGTYDGVGDPVVGAKDNWREGVYVDGSSLRAGRERWCASCHDESPSVVHSIRAPNIVGDEDGSYTYGTGWGYYKTGHGLASNELYPASGGAFMGAQAECDSCHDYTTTHVDGLSRTYDDSDREDTNPGIYRQGYRLKLINGQEPLGVPWPQNITNSADQYRLCAQSGCHDVGPFVDSTDLDTNLRTDDMNRHESHLAMTDYHFSSDWSGINNSRINCISCHNVHGSTRLAMVRDGRLIDQEPGLQVWYYNDSLTLDEANADPPIPEDMSLSASTGIVWIPDSASNLCTTSCHSNGNSVATNRAPWWDSPVPVLDLTNEANYQEAGVFPELLMTSGGMVEFRVKYTDKNNDPPSSIQVWIDQNDDGLYDVTERYGMTEDFIGDINLADGKIYTWTQALTFAGDGNLTYRFYATDGAHAAVGAAISERMLSIDQNGKRDVPGEYPTIQAAIDASTGEDVLVSDGTYSENIDFKGKAIAVQSANGATSTTIQGSGVDSPVVRFTSGETASSILDGFTIDNQASSGSATHGIYIHNSGPIIRDSTVRGNSVSPGHDGAGIYIGGGEATIQDTVIGGDASGPNQGDHGAGIFAADLAATLSIDGSTVQGNQATLEGGGIYIGGAGSTLLILNSRVAGNSADSGGGIAVGLDAVATITNCTVSGNTAAGPIDGNGGGIHNSGTLDIMNSTIAGNYASNNGGGLSGAGIVTNSIVWANGSGASGAQVFGAPLITYSDVEGSYEGVGNLNADPVFVDLQQAINGNPTVWGDFHIKWGSPVIDQGTDVGAPLHDIDRDIRPQGSGFDVGSDEFVAVLET